MSVLEEKLLAQIDAAGLPRPHRQHKLHVEGRRNPFRFDFAWPYLKLAVEVQGGTWQKKGGHTTGTGYERDCVKANEAALQGWLLLRVTGEQIETGQAMAWIERVLMKGGEPWED